MAVIKPPTMGHTPDPSKLPAIKDGQVIYDEATTTQFVDIKDKRYQFGSVLTGYYNTDGAFVEFTEDNKKNIFNENIAYQFKDGQRILCNNNKIYTIKNIWGWTVLIDENCNCLTFTEELPQNSHPYIYTILTNNTQFYSVLIHACDFSGNDNILLLSTKFDTEKNDWTETEHKLLDENGMEIPIGFKTKSPEEASLCIDSNVSFKGIIKIISVSTDDSSQGFYIIDCPHRHLQIG